MRRRMKSFPRPNHPTKNPVEVVKVRLGGIKGRKVRPSTLSSNRRSEIAKKAVYARLKKMRIRNRLDRPVVAKGCILSHAFHHAGRFQNPTMKSVRLPQCCYR